MWKDVIVLCKKLLGNFLHNLNQETTGVEDKLWEYLVQCRKSLVQENEEPPLKKEQSKK